MLDFLSRSVVRTIEKEGRAARWQPVRCDSHSRSRESDGTNLLTKWPHSIRRPEAARRTVSRRYTENTESCGVLPGKNGRFCEPVCTVRRLTMKSRISVTRATPDSSDSSGCSATEENIENLVGTECRFRSIVVFLLTNI